MDGYHSKVKKCWMCGKIKKLTEHHIIPKTLRRLVPKLNGHTILLCSSCHAKIHILLPRFFSDGSYRWKGSEKWETIKPEWIDWSKEEILIWDGNGEDGNGNHKLGDKSNNK